MYLPYLPVQTTSEGCSNLSTKVSLETYSFADSALEEINSEAELTVYDNIRFFRGRKNFTV